MKTSKDGCALIAAERKRQIEEEGWTAEHDDSHGCGEMAMAAACYATLFPLYEQQHFANEVHYVDPWPWDERWDKRPRDGNVLLCNRDVSVEERIGQLVKAGALIAAEIDRLQRAEGEGEKG